MSRSSRTTHSAMAPMPTPADRDVVMGPPPLPPQITLSGSGDSRSRETQETADKYKKLKRKYHELEEKHRETVHELRSSGDRNVKWLAERAMLMERIVELEAQAVPHHSNVPFPVSSAYPRTLLQPAAQRRFATNLDKAILEVEQEDVPVDPVFQSKHIGPNARRRLEAEMKERVEEEQREARRVARRPRGRAAIKEREREIAVAAAHTRAGGSSGLDSEKDVHRGERERDRAEREREGTGPPLTLAPPPGSQRDSRSAASPSPSIVVTTSGGSTRLRIKPTVAQVLQHEPSPPPSPHRHGHHHHHRHMDHDYEDHQSQHDQDLQRERELELQQREREQRELETREREKHEKERILALELEHQREMERKKLERERERERERELREQEERERAERERDQREREMERAAREREREERERQMQVDHRPPSPPPMEPLEPMRVSPVETASPHPPMRRDSGAAASPVSPAPLPSVPVQGPSEYPGSERYPYSPDHQPSTSREPQWGQWPVQGSGPSPATSSRDNYRYPDPYDADRRQHYTQYDGARSPVEMSARLSPQVHSPHPHPTPSTPTYNYPQQIVLGPGVGGPMPYFPHPGGPGNGGPPPGSRAKPKRLKAHTVTSRSYSIPMVPRDRKGRPLLPLNVGIMTVISLGEVCMREHFHTERYIFPVGYEVTRRYLSTVDPNAEVVYRCKILDGGDGPKFQITSDDLPEKTIVAGTATGAWSVIVRCANHIRNRQHSNSVSGPDFFGLGQNTIKHLIQELPGADRLRDYVWQNFVEGGPLGGRHAAVIPALPEPGEQQDEPDNMLNPNGSSMSVISMGATPSPQPAYDDGQPELQIIHMDAPDAGQQTGPHPMASIMDRTPLKSITFHQERPPGERSARARRQQNAQSHAEDRELRAATAPRASSRQHSPHAQHAHSPLLPQRTQSHSPALHRGEREPYSPHAVYERAPFPPPPAAPTPQPTQVPAPFASIMNAYNAPPKSPESPYETTPMNGGVSRLRGSSAAGAER